MDLCDGSDLEFHLKVHKVLAEKEVRLMFVQVLCALKYLNELETPIIHYDLKPGELRVCLTLNSENTQYSIS